MHEHATQVITVERNPVCTKCHQVSHASRQSIMFRSIVFLTLAAMAFASLTSEFIEDDHLVPEVHDTPPVSVL